MSIVFRSTSKGWGGFNVAWDKNRTDIAYVKDDNVKGLSASVCGFVHFRTADRTLKVTDRQNHRKERVDHISAAIQSKKDQLETFWSGPNSPPVQAKAALASAIATNQPLAVISQLQSESDNWNTLADRFKTAIDDLPWPSLPTDTQMTLRFAEQPVVANGTGFAISHGFVMTAAHVLKSSVHLGRSKVYFNLHSTGDAPPKAGWFTSPKDPSELVAKGPLKSDSEFEIKRIVLRSSLDGDLDLPVDKMTDNDVCIVELDMKSAAKTPKWPRNLELASTLPSVGTRVQGFGHTGGLPLKHMYRYSGASSEPQIRYSPAADAAHRACPAISVDLDIAPGASGGPLLTTDVDPPCVVGVARSFVDLGSLPQPLANVSDPLVDEIKKWFRQTFEEFGASQARIDSVTTKLGLQLATDWDEMRLDRLTKTWGFKHVLPDDERVKLRRAWNRTDLYRPFIQPFVEIGVKESWYAFGQAVKPSQQSSSNSMKADHVYSWGRHFTAAEDFEPNATAWYDEPSTSLLELPAFNDAQGLLAWEHLQVEIPFDNTDPTLAVDKITGVIQVDFGYEQGTPKNATRFEIVLNFQKVDPKDWRKWQATVGESVSRTHNGQGKVTFVEHNPDSIWKGPKIIDRPTLTRPTKDSAAMALVENMMLSANLFDDPNTTP